MSKRRVLTAEEIFICNDLPREWVSIPEWKSADGNGEDVGVYVRTLGIGEKEKWQWENNEGAGGIRIGLVRASAIALACVDEAGSRIFTDPDAVHRLVDRNPIAGERIYDVFLRLNQGPTNKDVEQEVKN